METATLILEAHAWNFTSYVHKVESEPGIILLQPTSQFSFTLNVAAVSRIPICIFPGWFTLRVV